MGIDIAGLRFLRYALSGQALGDTLTLGRQEIHISAQILRHETGMTNPDASNPFCEWLLETSFSASKVASMDISNYEHATLIHDINKPIPIALMNRFDSVLDFGTLEHVFNFPQAVQNCIAMCKTDGMIVHVLPANNQCGHGFWQVSPELFFSLYNETNGFCDTEVYLVSPNRPSEFFRVKKPTNGQRANVKSKNDLVVAVFTRKSRNQIGDLSVQQSDYVEEWSNQHHTTHSTPSNDSPLKRWAAKYPPLYEFLSGLNARFNNRKTHTGFDVNNPWLERVDIRRG